MVRYNSINEVLKKRFGCRVFKVSLDSGLGCPNRLNSASGCIFCNENAYTTAAAMGEKTRSKHGISEMLEQGIGYVEKRHRAAKFISYFQSGTNTYAPAKMLEPMFEAALDHPKVVGLAVGTRPDCIKPEHADLFARLSERTMLWVELGLQSASDDTLKLINRGHSVADFVNASRVLKQRNVPVVAHVILGLPGEGTGQMLKTAKLLNDENIDGVKIHNLHVLKGTRLERIYNEGTLDIPDLQTYAVWVADFIENLKPSMLIHRVNGHAPRHLTVAPKWSINKLAIFNAVGKEMERRDTWQGKKLIASP